MPLSCHAREREEEHENEEPAQTTVSPWWIPLSATGL